jgi:hypothetical protein
MRAVHRAPTTVERVVMSAELPPGESKPHRLPARFARDSFFNLASGGASRACGSVWCTTARLCFAEKSLSGRFELAHFAPFWAVTGFSRYAERVGFRAQRYAPLQVRSVEFGHRSVHRFGKPLIMQVFKQPAFGAAPGSAGRRSCCFILTAGAQGRTNDNALRPALREAGSCDIQKLTNVS